MNRAAAEFVMSAVCLLVGVTFLLGSLQLGIGELAEPGAGMLPAFAAFLLAVLSLGGVVKGFAARDASGVIALESGAVVRVGALVASVAGMAIAAPYTGFFAASAVMLFVLFHFVGALSLVRSLVAAAIGAVVNYGLFAVLLKVPLP